jgi:hypothetical protein
MCFFHIKKLELKEFGGRKVLYYAILSYTWGKEEIIFQNIKMNKAMESKGYKKVRNTCSVATTNRFEYIWIDICYINKTNNIELSEALNFIYR